MHIVTDKLITFTEYILTKRKISKQLKIEKQKKLHPILDWLGAFLWAAGFVLILNQYLFQAYVIPSKSMESTLEVSDRIIVNKFIYGPEILPGIFKLPGISSPKRTDVIIFENPEYVSKGSIFELFQRLVFMLTLSMVDLDKDSNGNPAHHFLIKRAVGSSGDILQFRHGELFIKPTGATDFLDESDFKELSNINYNTHRLLTDTSYDVIDNKIRDSIYEKQNSSLSIYYDDLYFSQKSNYKYLSHISPSVLNYYQNFIKQQKGFYIPEGWILPLGDNRDNSKDGRYFGIVKQEEVLGKASFKFWPFNRIGKIR